MKKVLKQIKELSCTFWCFFIVWLISFYSIFAVLKCGISMDTYVVELIKKYVILYIFSLLIALIPAFIAYHISWGIFQLRVRKEQAFKDIQQIIDTIVSGNPFLSRKLGKVHLYISDKKEYNACAVGKNSLFIYYNWYKDFYVHPDYVETTICHELGHLMEHTRIKYHFFHILKCAFNKYFDKKNALNTWHKEFYADYNGFRICTLGNNKTAAFVGKFNFLQAQSPGGKSFDRTHPPHAERIDFLANGIRPTYKEVKKVFEKYYGK